MLAVEPLRLRPPLDHRASRLDPADRTTAEPAGGENVHGNILEQAGKTRAAFVGDQQHAVAAALELRRERMGRDHMATGSPGSESEIHVVSDSPLHFTT